jgi:hypothetical protein
MANSRLACRVDCQWGGYGSDAVWISPEKLLQNEIRGRVDASQLEEVEAATFDLSSLEQSHYGRDPTHERTPKPGNLKTFHPITSLESFPAPRPPSCRCL